MTTATFRRRGIAVLASLCLLGSLDICLLGPGNNALAQDARPVREVGGNDPTSGAGWGSLPKIELLDARLDLSAQYTAFTNESMKQTYDGLPVFTAGVSFQATDRMRSFVSVGYGRAHGDPFQGQPGFSKPDGSTINAVPVQVGLRFDLAHSERLRVNMGAALELAWMRETVPALNDQGQPGERTFSDVNPGFQLTFGPELLLGEGGSALGLELGWGGAKGSVYDGNSRHGLNLTGYQGRLYFARKL